MPTNQPSSLISFDVSEIIPDKLWQSGGVPNLGAIRKLGVHVVCDLASAFDTPIFRERPEEFVFLSWPLVDREVLPDLTTAHAIAEAIILFMNAGKRVLVHCHSGRNRSSLIVGLILYQLGIAHGPSLVSLIRNLRDSPMVLSNQTFAKYLTSLH